MLWHESKWHGKMKCHDMKIVTTWNGHEIKLNEITWDEMNEWMKWNTMKCNELYMKMKMSEWVTWDEMQWHEMSWSAMAWNGMKLKCHEMIWMNEMRWKWKSNGLK